MALFRTMLLAYFALTVNSVLRADQRPNILWITLEDIGPDLGCYGVDYAHTPQMDQLASDGFRYTRAWSNAGMCAPARSTLITGMYPPTIGTQNMRSDVTTPDFVRAFPEYLRREGYFTSNHHKTDYNWTAPEDTWDVQSQNWIEDGWRQRKSGQPFFTVINVTETHASQMYWRGEQGYRNRIAELDEETLCDPDEVNVPPYYPDHPAIRAEMARYHDNITFADGLVAKILKQLSDDGLAESTIVFLFSDHGRGLPRSKGWCFYSSLNVPLIIRVPEAFQSLAEGNPGDAVDRIVSFVDFGPTVLSLAGVEPPEHMHGRPFLGEHQVARREFAFSYRDRMDERFDFIRSVWDGRYHYIRNYFPHLPWFHEQTRYYPHTQSSYKTWQELADQSTLEGTPAIYMARSRPAEMLFDTQADPNEINNLAADPAFADRLDSLRKTLHNWQDEHIDLGFMPESIWHEYSAQKGFSNRYEVARNHQELYPLSELRELADQIPHSSDSAILLKAMQSDIPATQFWGTLGVLARNDGSIEAFNELHRLLGSASPTVVANSAQALAKLGDTTDALPILLRILKHNDPIIGLRAANALDHLGEQVLPVKAALQEYENELAKLTMKDEPLGRQFIEWTLLHTLQELTIE